MPSREGRASASASWPRPRRTFCNFSYRSNRVLKFKNGQIRSAVTTCELCRDLCPIPKNDRDIFIFLNYMISSKNKVGCEDNSTGRQAATRIDQHGRFPRQFGGICQSVRKFH